MPVQNVTRHSHKKLKQHELIHSGEKPHTCSRCDKGFSLKADLTKSELIHTGYKPHVCSKCDKAFSLKADLTKHELIHTGYI